MKPWFIFNSVMLVLWALAIGAKCDPVAGIGLLLTGYSLASSAYFSGTGAR